MAVDVTEEDANDANDADAVACPEVDDEVCAPSSTFS